jgi:hypothetical protein
MAKSIGTLLRAPSGPIDLTEHDPRATPCTRPAAPCLAWRLVTGFASRHPPGGVCGAATVPLRRAPPCIHGTRTSGHGGHEINHLESAPWIWMPWR